MLLTFLVILCLLFVLFVKFIVGIYNTLIYARNDVKNSFARVCVFLKRRHDLIPNLVETVKGYSQHEHQVLEDVIKARQQAVNISNDMDIAKIAEAENQLSNTLRSLFALSEAYPELKANENFMSLQNELKSTEELIANARHGYNEDVMNYNNTIQIFPNVIFASMFNFKEEKFFETSKEDEKVPTVKF